MVEERKKSCWWKRAKEKEFSLIYSRPARPHKNPLENCASSCAFVKEGKGKGQISILQVL